LLWAKAFDSGYKNPLSERTREFKNNLFFCKEKLDHKAKAKLSQTFGISKGKKGTHEVVG